MNGFMTADRARVLDTRSMFTSSVSGNFDWLRFRLETWPVEGVARPAEGAEGNGEHDTGGSAGDVAGAEGVGVAMLCCPCVFRKADRGMQLGPSSASGGFASDCGVA